MWETCCFWRSWSWPPLLDDGPPLLAPDCALSCSRRALLIYRELVRWACNGEGTKQRYLLEFGVVHGDLFGLEMVRGNGGASLLLEGQPR